MNWFDDCTMPFAVIPRLISAVREAKRIPGTRVRFVKVRREWVYGLAFEISTSRHTNSKSLEEVERELSRGDWKVLGVKIKVVP